ncbi:putative RNA-directed DNA polymerase [Tanacetum coccineum]
MAAEVLCHHNNNQGHGNGRQFDWASTQNKVYGNCNRCGIGQLPSQCPNRDPSTIRTRPSANFANTRAQSSNASANWHLNTGANSHVTPDLEAMDNSEAYYGDDTLHVGNGKGLPILHIGSSKAPRAWFKRLSKALFDLGFKGSKTDPSLFIYSRGHTLLYILVYVDDIIITSNNNGTIDNIISQLGSAFALKDLAPLNYFLCIEIVPHVSGILLSQKKYILELLQSVGLSKCNLVSSPMVTSSSLSLDDSTAFSNPVKYRQVVGSLQYVTLSRPDTAFAVNKVCQYMHAPTENHWSAVKRILRYLHGMVEHGMLIRRSSGSTLQAFTDVLWKDNPDTSLEAFSDADWAGDSDDRRSTGGFAIYLGSNLISWTARKQRTVSRSSTEAEYKALADTADELTWLQALLHELGIRSSSTPILLCDNLGATYLSANPIFCARTKHVKIDYHFVREKVAQEDLRVQHISTHDQIAYIFTKPLPLLDSSF